MSPFGIFRFWKKTVVKTAAPAADIPLLSSLSPQEAKLIEDKVRRVEYKKGDIVYGIGEQAEAFYIILSGRFRVIGPRGNVLTVLSPGDYFGETSLLLGRSHSATVEARNDGIVLKIGKDDFQVLLREIPSFSLHLSRTLGHRLSRGFSRAEAAETKIAALLDFESEPDKYLFAVNLAAVLAAKGKSKTIFVDFAEEHPVKKTLAAGKVLHLSEFSSSRLQDVETFVEECPGRYLRLRVAEGSDARDGEKLVAALLSFLMERYEYVLLGLSKELEELSLAALRQADALYLLAGEEMRRTSKISLFLKNAQKSFGFTRDEIRLIVKENPAGRPAQCMPYSLNDDSAVPVFGFLPYEAKLEAQKPDSEPLVVEDPDSPYSKSVNFVAKELMGSLVGLALGSGAAFGFAHIGVLKVLEKEKIPIDIVAGSSIGALVGALWTSGLSAETLEGIAGSLNEKNIFFKLIGFRDFSLPHRGFFKGRQISRFLRSHIARTSFRAGRVPLKIVSTDLSTGEEMIFDDGDLLDAVRASIAIPGIFRPVRRSGHVFMDGGVADPLPVRALQRYGAKKIIAVNVLPSSEEHVLRKEFREAKLKESAKRAENATAVERLFYWIGKRLRSRYRDNIFDVLVNTIQFLEHGVAESNAQGADVVIHPVIANSHWAEFYSVNKFVRCGEEKTLEQLEEIKRLVEDT